MKKSIQFFVLLACAFLASAMQTSAQHPRWALMEQFTSATCPPCSANAPFMKKALLPEARVIAIKYHMNYPAAGDFWNLIQPASSTFQHNFYGISGIPAMRLNGQNANVPRSDGEAATLRDQALNIASQSSPLLITVQEARVNDSSTITVTVKNDGASTIGGQGFKLHTYLLNRYSNITNIRSILTSASGQTEYYDSKLFGFPANGQGADFSINAGETKTYTYKYKKGTDTKTWGAQQYTVAFVQNTSSREVLQAGTNYFDYIQRSRVNLVTLTANGDYFQAAQPDMEKERTITVTNPTPNPISIDLTIDNAASLIPATWDIPTISPENVTVPANGSVTATVSFRAGQRAGYLNASVKAVPAASETVGENIAASTTFGAISTNSKYLVLYGASNGIVVGGFGPLTSSAKYLSSTALAPINILNSDVLSGLDVKGIVFMGSYGTRGILQQDVTTQKLNEYYDNGVPLLVMGELEAFFATRSTASAGSRRLFGDILGIQNVKLDANSQPVSRFTQNQSNGQITFNSFNIRGMAADVPLGSKLNTSIPCNQPTQQYPFYNYFNDVMILKSGSKSKPFMYFGTTQTDYAGVRVEDGAKKAVYLGFTLDAIPSQAARNSVMEKLADYLFTEAAGPTLAIVGLSSANNINFGDVTIGQSMTKTVALRNTGASPLTIESVVIDDTDADILSSYQISGATFPLVLAPNTQQDLTVKLTPTKVASYFTSLLITSNSVTGAETSVPIDGNGITATSVEPNVSTDGTLRMSVYPNPINDVATVSYNVTGAGTQKVTITVTDALGNTVKTLMNSVVASGNNTISFSTEGIAGGAYRLVIQSNNGSTTFVPVVVVK